MTQRFHTSALWPRLIALATILITLGFAMIPLAAANDTDALAAPLSLLPPTILVPPALLAPATPPRSDRLTITSAETQLITHIPSPQAASPNWLQQLDTVETQTPWSVTTTLHLPIPLNLPPTPFIAIASENDSRLDDFRRLGLGGGASWSVSTNARLNAECLYLPANGLPTEPDVFGPEIRFITRLELHF